MDTSRYNYKFIPRLINRITKEGQPLNDYFSYYGYEITLMSGTPDYVEVIIDGRKKHYKWDYIRFSFDFWTKKLDFSVPESVKNTNDFTWRCMAGDVHKAFRLFYRGVKIDKRPLLIYN